jgi:hypothetical protein
MRDEKDLKMCMQDVNSVTDITKLLTTFALRTIATCLHILHDIPEGEDGDMFRKFLQFRRSSKMCPVKNDIFDVVFLVRTLVFGLICSKQPFVYYSPAPILITRV